MPYFFKVGKHSIEIESNPGFNKSFHSACTLGKHEKAGLTAGLCICLPAKRSRLCVVHVTVPESADAGSPLC
jgi:hypothetical protein